jgi:lipopolysaccharide export system permease protein
MLTINRALARELTSTTVAITFIFVALFMVVSLVKILAKAVAGSIPAKFIFTMLGLQTVEILGLMLPLAFYIGLLMTLSRWYRDSEMTVLHGCGVSLMQLLRPAATMGLVFAIIVGTLAFYLSPLASRMIAVIKQDEGSRYETAAVSPGVFNEFQSKKNAQGGVYYVEDIRPDGQMLRVFAATEHMGRQGVVVAKTGREVAVEDSEDRYLILSDGVRYDGAPGQGDYRRVVFERYTIRIDVPPPTLRFTPYNAMPVSDLFSDKLKGKQLGLATAEWHWRLSKPLALLVLMVFGFVFAYTNPRQGRYYSLFVAIVAYFLYSNLLGVGDAMLKRGRLPAVAGLWWVHALFLGIGLHLFWRRLYNKPLIVFPRWRRAST